MYLSHLKLVCFVDLQASPSSSTGRTPPRQPGSRSSPLTSPTNCSHGSLSPRYRLLLEHSVPANNPALGLVCIKLGSFLPWEKKCFNLSDHWRRFIHLRKLSPPFWFESHTSTASATFRPPGFTLKTASPYFLTSPSPLWAALLLYLPPLRLLPGRLQPAVWLEHWRALQVPSSTFPLPSSSTRCPLVPQGSAASALTQVTPPLSFRLLLVLPVGAFHSRVIGGELSGNVLLFVKRNNGENPDSLWNPWSLLQSRLSSPPHAFICFLGSELREHFAAACGSPVCVYLRPLRSAAHPVPAC